VKDHRFEIIDLKIDILVDEIKIVEAKVEVGALSPDEFVARSKVVLTCGSCSNLRMLNHSKGQGCNG